MQGVNKKHFGAELGIEAQVTPTIKLKAAGSLGQFTYNNNPNIYLTSIDFDAPVRPAVKKASAGREVQEI